MRALLASVLPPVHIGECTCGGCDTCGVLHSVAPSEASSGATATTGAAPASIACKVRAALSVEGVRAGIAACVSSLALFVLSPDEPGLPRGNPHTTVALHLLVRAVEMLLRDSVRRGALPNVPHFDVLVFQTSCTAIMYAWFYHPSELPRVYRHWITVMADMDVRLLTALQGLKDGSIRYGTHHDVLRQYCVDWGLPVEAGDPGNGLLPCSTVHPMDPHSCNGNGWRRFHRGFWRAMRMYLPVHVASQLLQRAPVQAPPAALRGRSRTLSGAMLATPPRGRADSTGGAEFELPESPDRQGGGVGGGDAIGVAAERGGGGAKSAADKWWSRLKQLAMLLLRSTGSAMRSSAFLGAFIAIIWRTVCLMRNTLKDDKVAGPFMGSALCGLSVLIERDNRRAELACYVAPRALQTLWGLAAARRAVQRVPYGDIGLFGAALGIFLYYWHEAEEARPSSSLKSVQSSTALAGSMGPEAADEPLGGSASAVRLGAGGVREGSNVASGGGADGTANGRRKGPGKAAIMRPLFRKAIALYLNL